MQNLRERDRMVDGWGDVDGYIAVSARIQGTNMV